MTYRMLEKNKFIIEGEEYSCVFEGTESDAEKKIEDLLKEDLEKKKKELLKKVNDDYQNKMNRIKENIPEDEIRTWNQQKAEYDSYKKDSSSQTPAIDTIAISRGISKADLITKIEKKIIFTFQLLGEKQKREDLIEKATTLEVLESIEL